MHLSDLKFLAWMPMDGIQIFAVLFLTFLIGLQREGHKGSGQPFSFGGVRSYPIIGLVGFGTSVLAGQNLTLVFIGFGIVTAFLLMAYWRKVSASEYTGATSELTGLVTYLIGPLVNHDQLWVATAITVASVLLLELKDFLEGLAKKIEAADILAFTKFLLLSAVILPVLPNQAYTDFQINPFATWLVVVAVSGVSYTSYVLQRIAKGHGGILLTALLGGAYSSTITTVVLARRSHTTVQDRVFSGGILMASGMMYGRVAILLAIFNQDLMLRLAGPFVALAGIAIAGGFIWARTDVSQNTEASETSSVKNPLETQTAFIFAGLFIVMIIATYFAVRYLGAAGMYALAAVMGVTDVDPFIMSLTQTASSLAPTVVTANAILIATASNNLVKGVYAYTLASQRTGRQSLIFLIALTLMGLLPLLFS